MTATGVVFLASSLDEAEVKAGTYKTGNTDVIRTMLREQQKECQQLHANHLFREFRDEGQKVKKFGKGYAVQPEQNQPLVIDFQAEGQARLFELIKQRAIKEEKPLQGVWASFSKPYVCLGEPKEPPSGLPPLNRDEMANADGKGSKNIRGKLRTQELARMGTAGSSGRRRGTANSNASMTKEMSPSEVEEMKLIKNKTIMRFGGNDLLECKFPEGPLRMAANRRTRSMIRLGAFNDAYQADMEAQDPLLAYGQPQLVKRQLSPVKRGRVEDLDGSKNQVFITQGAGAAQEDAVEGDGSRRQSNAGLSRASNDGTRYGAHRISYGGSAPFRGQTRESDEEVEAGPSQPAAQFQRLVELAVPERGREDNPVYGWHNKFVEVRQKGRESLQQALYERSQGRFKARSFGHMAANLCSLLMLDLSEVQGKKIPYASVGVMPNNPYKKMEDVWAAQEETRKVRNQRAQTLDPEQLRVMQRFYDQLCALVEAQRMSDPLSLMIVHRVRALLEAGSSLHKGLLNTVLEHVAKFTKGCGLVRHNQYMLSILTFISKCTSVSDADFEDMVTAHGLPTVVYGTSETPSHIAAAEAAAAAASATTPSSRQGAKRGLRTGGGSSSARRESSGKEGKGASTGEGQEFEARGGAGDDEAGSAPGKESSQLEPEQGETEDEGVKDGEQQGE